jgi:hypothetical protein
MRSPVNGSEDRWRATTRCARRFWLRRFGLVSMPHDIPSLGSSSLLSKNPLENQAQRDALDYLQGQVRTRGDSLADPSRTLKQSMTRYYVVMRAAGITRRQRVSRATACARSSRT